MTRARARLVLTATEEARALGLAPMLHAVPAEGKGGSRDA